jgi:LAO/AO transport system kinase
MSLQTETLADELLAGSRKALAKAITLVESSRSDHRKLATQLLKRLMPHTGNAIRLGVSGAPGVGRSTFIESMGNHILDQGYRLAVLTVDPTSLVSGGSILGDKTRMHSLSRRSEAYIRPSPAGQSLGGVARRSYETLLLCEAAGYDVIIVETVGVGQSETKVSQMTDLFILLLLPVAGDELQGIKRGIMELADLILINKADDDLLPLARRTEAEYRNAMRLLHPSQSSGREVEVKICSSRDGTGIADAWNKVLHDYKVLNQRDELATIRGKQAKEWMWSEIHDSLIDKLKNDPELTGLIPELETRTISGKLPSSIAAELLLNSFLNK